MARLVLILVIIFIVGSALTEGLAEVSGVFPIVIAGLIIAMFIKRD